MVGRCWKYTWLPEKGLIEIRLKMLKFTSITNIQICLKLLYIFQQNIINLFSTEFKTKKKNLWGQLLLGKSVCQSCTFHRGHGFEPWFSAGSVQVRSALERDDFEYSARDRGWRTSFYRNKTRVTCVQCHPGPERGWRVPLCGITLNVWIVDR